MTKVSGNLWEATFARPHPPGTASMRVDIDCPPDTPGYPSNPANISNEDAFQLGDIVFLDPSGRVLDVCTNDPIQGATVTLLKEFPPSSGNFIVPSVSDHLPEDNPQTTPADGSYAWDVTPGVYKLNVSSTGFVTTQSSNLEIPPPVIGLDILLPRIDGCPVPLQSQKESIISDLQSKLPTGDKKSDKELEKAIDHITKSVDDKFWVDDNTLDPKDGKKVFDEDKNAVKRLLKVDAIDVSSIIAQIVTIDAQLATDAIAEAGQFAGDDKVDKELEKANEELQKAQEELDKGNPDKAIDHYKKAWDHAQKAIKAGNKSN